MHYSCFQPVFLLSPWPPIDTRWPLPAWAISLKLEPFSCSGRGFIPVSHNWHSPPRFLYLLFTREFLIDRNIISFTSPILVSLKKSFTTSFRGICKLDYTCMVTRSLFFIAVMFTDNFFKPKAQVFPPIEPQSCLKKKSHLSKSVVTRSRYNFNLCSSSVGLSIGQYLPSPELQQAVRQENDTN